MKELRIGTRGSPLALWQARAVAAAIQAAGGPPSELVPIKTTGDRMAQAPLSAVGGKRLFVKEIEEALLAASVDLAVHSAKDLPVEIPAGLHIDAALPREDPRDAFVVSRTRDELAPAGAAELVESVGPSARIGTGSIRRKAQLARAFADVTVAPVRGNLGTRLRKLDSGEYDLLVLAAAGLVRLDLAHRIAACLPFETCVPAPGQGIVAVETRTDDSSTRNLVTRISNTAVSAALRSERALATALGGGCDVPLGAVATVEADGLNLRAVVASPDGSQLIRAQARAPVAEASALGERVARDLLADGAEILLANLDHL